MLLIGVPTVRASDKLDDPSTMFVTSSRSPICVLGGCDGVLVVVAEPPPWETSKDAIGCYVQSL